MDNKAFLSAYLESTEQNPLCSRERLWNRKAGFILHNFGKSIVFEMRSLERGKGYGSQALNWLCELAAKYDVTLSGHAAPFGTSKPMLNKHQLKQWYKRHGFLVTRCGEIRKIPQEGRI